MGCVGKWRFVFAHHGFLLLELEVFKRGRFATCRILESALPCGIIDVNDAEPLLVAMCPLEIVHNGPQKVTLNHNAIVDGAF